MVTHIFLIVFGSGFDYISRFVKYLYEEFGGSGALSLTSARGCTCAFRAISCDFVRLRLLGVMSQWRDPDSRFHGFFSKFAKHVHFGQRCCVWLVG